MKLSIFVIIAAIVIGGFAGAGLMDTSFSTTGAVVGGVGAGVLIGLLVFLDAQETKREEKVLRNREERESIHRETEQEEREAEIRNYKEEIRRYKREMRKYEKRLEKIEEAKRLEEMELEEEGDYRSLLKSYVYSVQVCQQCGMSVIG